MKIPSPSFSFPSRLPTLAGLFPGGPAAPLPGQFTRVVTGLILAAALLACLILGGIFLAVILALVSALALFEFFQMIWPGKTKLCSKAFGIFLTLALFCPAGGDEAVPVILCLALAWAAVSFLLDFGLGNGVARLESHAVLPLGLLYIPLILRLALSLSLKEQLLVVAAAVASDTAAYYFGCAFGRHKIWPAVSPKKSWEGSIAGFAATILVALAVACLPYGGPKLFGGGWLLWVGIGAALNVAAQVGDFFESALKRSCKVKDSSELLPGHGGILDRIDSILFTLAAFCAIRLVIELAAGPGKAF